MLPLTNPELCIVSDLYRMNALGNFFHGEKPLNPINVFTSSTVCMPCVDRCFTEVSMSG